MKAGGIILKKNDSPAFFQSRLTDTVSVILSELLSYEHPPNFLGGFLYSPNFAIKRSLRQCRLQKRKSEHWSEPVR